MRKYEITKEQIITIESDGIGYIKDWFPEVFDNKKGHNFPKGKDVCCNVVLSNKDMIEVFKLCFENGVEIHDNLIESGYKKRYLCFGETIGIDKLCTCDSDHFTTFDENVFDVSFEEFKNFIVGKGKIITKSQAEKELNCKIID